MDQDDLLVFEDLVDDAIVASSRRPQTLEFTNQRLAETVRVLSDRPEDGLQCGVAHLLRKLVEMTETLSRDLNLVHPATSDVVLETHSLALLSVATRTAKRLHQLIIFEDVEGLFEGLKVVRAQQHERRSPVPSNQDTVVLALDPVCQLREMGLGFRERKCFAHTGILHEDTEQVNILTYTGCLDPAELTGVGVMGFESVAFL